MLAKDNAWTDEATEIWVGKPTLTKFKIFEVYKGDAQAEIEAYHPSKSVIGMDFLKGHEYLILIKSKDRHGFYNVVSQCAFSVIDETNPSDIYLRAKSLKAKAE